MFMGSLIILSLVIPVKLANTHVLGVLFKFSVLLMVTLLGGLYIYIYLFVYI